jgi:hypothetical protein
MAAGRGTVGVVRHYRVSTTQKLFLAVGVAVCVLLVLVAVRVANPGAEPDAALRDEMYELAVGLQDDLGLEDVAGLEIRDRSSFRPDPEVEFDGTFPGSAELAVAVAQESFRRLEVTPFTRKFNDGTTEVLAYLELADGQVVAAVGVPEDNFGAVTVRINGLYQ